MGHSLETEDAGTPATARMNLGDAAAGKQAGGGQASTPHCDGREGPRTAQLIETGGGVAASGAAWTGQRTAGRDFPVLLRE